MYIPCTPVWSADPDTEANRPLTGLWLGESWPGKAEQGTMCHHTLQSQSPNIKGTNVQGDSGGDHN